MKQNKEFYSSRGSVVLNIILMFALVVIALVIYRLSTVSRTEMPTQSVHGIESVARTTNTVTTESRDASEFSDRLTNPASSTNFATDELGAGVTNVAVFERDLDGDGRDDRITRTHVATENAHDYDEYKIELNRGNGEYVDITPDDFRTVQGADCALAKLQFEFTPTFRVVKIARPFRDTWATPTAAVRTVYAISNGEMVPTATRDAGTVCDVSQLF